MKAYIITLTNDPTSVQLKETLKQSVKDTDTQLELVTYKASTPETFTEDSFRTFGKTLRWTWSSSPEEDSLDFDTGLWKKHYPSVDQMRVRSCALSHFRLWKQCFDSNDAIAVFEHDALFVKKFDPSNYIHKKWGVLGLNNPIGNTRKAQRFHAGVSSQGKGIHDIPKIDFDGELPLPMGLAGNSAYMIRPHAAKKLLDLVEEKGMWPNDAIMCKQLMPGLLKQVFPYYTDTQENVSSTTK
jgi:hypothetical protein